MIVTKRRRLAENSAGKIGLILPPRSLDNVLSIADTDYMVINYQDTLPILKVRCRICEYIWAPRKAKSPERCPNCHSRCWYRLSKSRKNGQASQPAGK